MVKGKKVAIRPPAMACQHGAQPEAQRQDAGRGDAHQLGGGAVIGHGPDVLADGGAVQEKIQAAGDQHGCQGRDQARPQHRDRSESEAAGREVDRVGRGREDRGAYPDDDHIDGESGQQGGKMRRIDHAVNGDDVDDDAADQAGDGDQDQGDIGVEVGCYKTTDKRRTSPGR